MLDIFNAREISIGIWLLLLLIWSLKRRSFQSSVINILKALANKQIILSYILALAYSLLGVYILKKMGLWTIDQLKDTALWCIVTIFSTLMNLNSIREDKNFFREAVRENFKFSVITGFINGLYTFNLGIEIVFVPLLAALVLIEAVTKTKPELIKLQAVISRILLAIGLVMIGYTFYKIFVNIKNLASYNTLRDFILSPFLAIWFLPFIFIMTLYMAYENNHISLSSRITDKKLLSFAKWQILFRFNIDTKAIERWRKRIYRGSINSKEDVIRSIKEIKRLQEIEKRPPLINPQTGWSPYACRKFLLNQGIETNYYENSYQDEWMASSKYIKLDNAIFGNSISYYIQGNETTAKLLKLVLDVKNFEQEEEVIARFIEISKNLYSCTTHSSLQVSIVDALKMKRPIKVLFRNIEVSVKKEQWYKQEFYSITFTVQHN